MGMVPDMQALNKGGGVGNAAVGLIGVVRGDEKVRVGG